VSEDRGPLVFAVAGEDVAVVARAPERETKWQLLDGDAGDEVYHNVTLLLPDCPTGMRPVEFECLCNGEAVSLRVLVCQAEFMGSPRAAARAGPCCGRKLCTTCARPMLVMTAAQMKRDTCCKSGGKGAVCDVCRDEVDRDRLMLHCPWDG